MVSQFFYRLILRRDSAYTQKKNRDLYEREWLVYDRKAGYPWGTSGLFPDIGTVLTLIATLVETSPMAVFFKYVLHVRWWLHVDEQCTRWLFLASRHHWFAAPLPEWLLRLAATLWTSYGEECRPQQSMARWTASIITQLPQLSQKFTSEFKIVALT